MQHLPGRRHVTTSEKWEASYRSLINPSDSTEINSSLSSYFFNVIIYKQIYD